MPISERTRALVEFVIHRHTCRKCKPNDYAPPAHVMCQGSIDLMDAAHAAREASHDTR